MCVIYRRRDTTYCLLLAATYYYSHSKIGKVGCFNGCIVEKGKLK